MIRREPDEIANQKVTFLGSVGSGFGLISRESYGTRGILRCTVRSTYYYSTVINRANIRAAGWLVRPKQSTAIMYMEIYEVWRERGRYGGMVLRLHRIDDTKQQEKGNLDQ